MTVSVRADLSAAQQGARSPELANLSCFAVIVGGGPSPVSSGQLGLRSPSCLKLDGSFLGPYTYSDITAGQGIQVTVPAGSYTFSIVGFNRTGGCGNSVSSLYSAPLAETYSVAVGQTVNLSRDTQISLAPTAYSTAATDLTPLCPPQSFNCLGTLACDTFTDSDLTLLGTHIMNVGSGWTADQISSPTISGNRANLGAVGAGLLASLATTVNNTDVLVRGTVTLGNAGSVQAGIFGRRGSADTYAFARVTHNVGGNNCVFELGHMVAGLETVEDAVPLTVATECQPSQPIGLVLNLSGAGMTANYGSHNLYGPASGAVNGLSVGGFSTYSGFQTIIPFLDDFSASDSITFRKLEPIPWMPY